MSVRAFATPDSLSSSFKDLDVDIGPRVEHVYDVINHGPYDVGHLIVSISNLFLPVAQLLNYIRVYNHVWYINGL